MLQLATQVYSLISNQTVDSCFNNLFADSVVRHPMVLLTAVQVHPLQLGKHHQVQCQMKLLSEQGGSEFTLYTLLPSL